MPPDRLTILQQAQLLHDATLSRHGELLDRLEDARLEHAEVMRALRGLQERQQTILEMILALLHQQEERLAQHEAQMTAVRAILQAITGPRLVNVLGVIRSSPLAGLCYDTPSVEVGLFPVDTLNKTPWTLS